MEYRVDKFLWVLACSICTVTTALLFVPSVADIYFSVGRYFIYFALFVGLVALIFVWVRSFKLKGWRTHVLASIKTLVFGAVFSIAFIILAVSHSGI